MLGKLLKHEFKSTGKVLIPVNLVLIIITIAGSVLLGTKLLEREELLPVSMILLTTYILMLFALSIATMIFLLVHYYRNMFSAQGYLTFTLPASTWSILNAKLITGFVWVLVNTVLTLISIGVLVVSAAGLENIASVGKEILISNIMNGTESMAVSILDVLGYTPVQFVLFLILLILTACFYNIAMGYGSITIGQLYAKHKVVGAVLAYFAIYVVMQIIATVVMFIGIFGRMFNMITVSAGAELEGQAFVELMQSIYRPMFPMFIILYFVMGILCYVASVIIIKKRINLD